MKTRVFEATNLKNWGKFLVAQMDAEWEWRSEIDVWNTSLLGQIGWAPQHIWVMDLQTCEGAGFALGGHAHNDLEKHKIWVCPMFEPFLAWLYTQKLDEIWDLPQVVELPDAAFNFAGYRRPGPKT